MAEREFPTSVRQRGEQSWTNRRPGKKRLSLLLAFSAIDIIAFRNPTRIRTRREKRKIRFLSDIFHTRGRTEHQVGSEGGARKETVQVLLGCDLDLELDRQKSLSKTGLHGVQDARHM